MFKTMKELFTSGNKDLRRRVYFTLACLTVFILGISIRVPGTEDLTKNLGFLELINTIGGGAFRGCTKLSDLVFKTMSENEHLFPAECAKTGGKM